MSNPFIPLAKQALKSDLNKNDLRLFLALTVQTLGYHKDADPLTDKRLAQLTGIRLDHLRACIDRFLDYGLFERSEHAHYDYLYSICDDFLDDEKVYPPTLPRGRSARKATAQRSVNVPNDGVEPAPCSVDFTDDGAENAPRSVGFPNDGGHTTENLNNKKTLQQKTTTETEKNTDQKKPQQQKKITTEKKAEPIITQAQPQPSVTISLSGDSLNEDLIIESSQPIRLQICAKKEKQVSNDVSDMPEKATTSSFLRSSVGMQSATLQSYFDDAGASGYVFPRWNVGTSDKSTTSSFPRTSVGMQSATLQRCFDDAGTSGDVLKAEIAKPVTQPVADLAVSVANSLIQPSDNHEEPFVVVDEKEEEKTAEKTIAATTPKPTTRPLPKAIDKDDHQACNRYFQPLNAQQQKDVLTVFYHNLKTSKINSKVGYFISLCQKVKSPSGLTVPHEAIVKKEPTPEQLALDKKANAAQEKRMILWSDYQGVKNQAALLNKSEAETAQLLGFEEAYALFGEQVAEVV